MASQPITAEEVANWSSLESIADSFAKLGIEAQHDLGEENELVLSLSDNTFITLVQAAPEESPDDYKPESRSRHTNLIASHDFEEFTFLSRLRSWGSQQHGRIKYQRLSFDKEQVRRDSGEKRTLLEKINAIEPGKPVTVYEGLYDTKRVIKKFYEDFEELRVKLVKQVAGIPDDRGEAKQQYVQVILDRMIFLYFIQEKELLDRNTEYLHEQPAKIVADGADRYTEFYEPLFFKYLAENQQDPEFGNLPYLNGGLFAKNSVEEEFENAKIGESAQQTNELFDEILEFLSSWNWNVDERLDIVDPKNLSPAILGHIFEQTVNQKDMGAYYTPEEITGFMARQTIHPYLLNQLNTTANTSYQEIDEVFGFSDVDTDTDAAVADGGAVTPQTPVESIELNHVETLYHDVLTEVRILDPAVGSGAFLLAAQEVLLDIYLQCIEYFQSVAERGQATALEQRTRDELDQIESGKGSLSLYAKRKIILENLYGVDIDEGATEICKLRLWLSMVADIESEPSEIKPLPNIEFNIRQGNSLIGYVDDLETALDDANTGDLVQSRIGSFGENSIKQAINEITTAITNHKEATSSEAAAKWRDEANQRIEKYRSVLTEKTTKEFQNTVDENITVEKVKRHSPFHWVIEFPDVFQQGGFDIAIGNPPWDKVKAERTDFFPKYDEVFRRRSDTGKDKDQIQKELLKVCFRQTFATAPFFISAPCAFAKP
jgi:hypothetical protein